MSAKQAELIRYERGRRRIVQARELAGVDPEGCDAVRITRPNPFDPPEAQAVLVCWVHEECIPADGHRNESAGLVDFWTIHRNCNDQPADLWPETRSDGEW